MEIRNIRKDGTPNGMNMRFNLQNNGNYNHVFQVMVTINKKTHCCTFSIPRHGYEGAWQMAVKRFLKIRSIHPSSKDAKLIRGAMKITMERV